MNAAVSSLRVDISGVAYHFDELAPIDTLPVLASEPELLARFKKTDHRCFARSHVSMTEQAVIAAKQSLDKTGLSPADIDAVIIGTSELRDWDQYPEYVCNEIMLALGLKDILAVGVTLAGCANFASSLRVARSMIAAENLRNVLVIETNQVRGNLERVVTSSDGIPSYIFGDGAVSYVATAASGEFSVLGMEQIVKPIGAGSSAEFISHNVGGFRHVAQGALDRAGVTREQIAAVIFHNINLRLQCGLLEVTGFPFTKLYFANLGRTGHMWGADNLVALHDYCAAENSPAGTLFMMMCQANTYFSAVVCQKR